MKLPNCILKLLKEYSTLERSIFLTSSESKPGGYVTHNAERFLYYASRG